MAKLVLLSEGFTGRAYDLKVDKTTIGRLEDNAFHIPEPSISGHHCEVLLRGNDVVVRDLNSTNGTFINGEPVKEAAVVKHGQILRLGQVEMRVETAPSASPPGKIPLDKTRAIPQGVKLDDLEQGKKPVFDKDSPFTKKSNKTIVIFAAVSAVLVVAFIIALFIAFKQMK